MCSVNQDNSELSKSQENNHSRRVDPCRSRVSVRFNLTLSLLLVIFSVLFNQWIVGYLFFDGHIGDFGTKLFLWIAEIAALLSAVYIFTHRKKIPLRNYFFASAMFGLLFAIFIVVDILLGIAGFPSQPALRVAHPPSYKEVKKSIGEFEYEFATNSQGLRYKEIGLDKESEGEKRILVIGDSYVEGQGVECDERFTSLLESRYAQGEDPVRFINGGLTGTALTQQMQLLFHIGLKYDIDGVVICIYSNDVTGVTDSPDYKPAIRCLPEPDGLAAAIDFFFPRIYTLVATAQEYPPDWEHLKGKRDIVKAARRRALDGGIPQNVIDDWEAGIDPELLAAANRFEFNGSILTCGLFAPDIWTSCLDIDTDSAKRRWLNLRKCLQFVTDQCRSRGIAVSLLYIPTSYQYNPDFHDKPTPMIRSGVTLKRAWLTETSTVQQNLTGWARTVNVPFLDLTQEFRKTHSEYDEDINYPLDTHWTALGHRIAAEAIDEWLRQENFLELGSLKD